MPKRLLAFLRLKEGGWKEPLTAALAVMGFVWGAWTFLFKEVLTPAVAPVNISLDLEIKRIELLGQTAGKPQPVLLRASARNASGKILTIRKTFWVAHATTVTQLFQKHGQCQSPTQLPPAAAESKKAPSLPAPPLAVVNEKDERKDCELKVIADVNDQMSLGSDQLSLDGTSASWYQRGKDTWDVIGFGSLFDANEIRPGEEIKAQRLVLVPQLSMPNDYQILRVRVIIPSYTKRSNLADEDLVRVVGGITKPSKDFVSVGFCQAERSWRKHGFRWFFDKFILPRDRFDDKTFREPASNYCPILMTSDQKEKIGAQVFVSAYEIPLHVRPEAIP